MVRAITGHKYEKKFSDILGEISSNLAGTIKYGEAGNSLGRYDDNIDLAVRMFSAQLLENVDLVDWTEQSVIELVQGIFDAFSDRELSALLGSLKSFGDFVQRNMPIDTGYTADLKSAVLNKLEVEGLKFLRPFVIAALDLDTPKAVMRLLSIGLFLKKLQTPIEDVLKEEGTLSWLKTEKNVGTSVSRLKKHLDAGDEMSSLEKLLKDAKGNVTQWCGKVANIYRFQHGSGQVREGVGTTIFVKNQYLVFLDRYNRLLELPSFKDHKPIWLSDLAQFSPQYVQTMANKPEDVDSVAWVMRQRWIAQLNEGLKDIKHPLKQYPRRTEVAKSFSSVRGIAMEAVPAMFAQQGVLKGLIDIINSDPILRVHANPASQDRQRQLAAIGCQNKNLATLDLSDASDLLSNFIVMYLFGDTPWAKVFEVLWEGKIGITSPTEETEISVQKFGNMGNAMTFPVQTLVYAAFAKAVYDSCKDTQTLPDGTEGWGVFGDDIIIAEGPTSSGESSVALLKKLLSFVGLKVNESKSYQGSNSHRESCGFWGFGINGVSHDVTPLYYTRPSKERLSSHTLKDAMRFVAFANNAKGKGFFLLRDVAAEIVRSGDYVTGREKRYFPAISTRQKDSTALWSDLDEVLKTTAIRYVSTYQRWEQKRWTIVQRTLGLRKNGKASWTIPKFFARPNESKDPGDKRKVVNVAQHQCSDISYLESLTLTDAQAKEEADALLDWFVKKNASSTIGFTSVLSSGVEGKYPFDPALHVSGTATCIRPQSLIRFSDFLSRPLRSEPKYEDFALFHKLDSKQFEGKLLAEVIKPREDDKLAFTGDSKGLIDRARVKDFYTWYYGLGHQLSRGGKLDSMLALHGKPGRRVLVGSVALNDLDFQDPFDAKVNYDSSIGEQVCIPNRAALYNMFTEVSSEYVRSALRKMALSAKALLDEESHELDESVQLEVESKWIPFVVDGSTLPDDVWFRLLSEDPKDAVERRLFSQVKVVDFSAKE